MKAELNPFWKHLTLGAAIGAMLLATSVAGVAEAQPASMPIAPMLNPTERVITISDQDVPLAATRYRSVMSKGVVDVKGEDVPLPAGVKLLPGEVVRITIAMAWQFTRRNPALARPPQQLGDQRALTRLSRCTRTIGAPGVRHRPTFAVRYGRILGLG